MASNGGLPTNNRGLFSQPYSHIQYGMHCGLEIYSSLSHIAVVWGYVSVLLPALQQ